MSEWISIDDGLPDSFDSEVLAYSSGVVYYCTFNGRFEHLGIDSLYIIDVTHWMYLPEPPK